jgi:3-oxoacyl-[acyl-carrier protein] reductase
MDITGSVAFVTGGSGGLGSVIAKALAGSGVDIAIGYRDSLERAQKTMTEVEALGQRATMVRLDQTDPASVEAAVEEVAEEFGGLDLLINNAGMASGGRSLAMGDLEALTPEIWDEMMAVNLRGPYLLARAAAPWLRRSNWGRIVNLGSTIGHGTWGAAAAYAPSKASVVPLTRFLAAALAPDVTVNCVAPGLMEGTLMSGGAPEAYVAEWRDRAVLGATTSLEDVAAQIVTFCKSATVTGQVLVIDGGIHFD